MVAYGTSPARLRPLPSLTQPGPCTSTTARGIFEIQNSTSDSKRRRDKQSYKDAEGSLGFPVFSEDSCSVLGGKISFLNFLCIYCLHNDATFKGYRNILISGMNYVIFCKVLAVHQLYIPRVAIRLVYSQHAYSLFISQPQRWAGMKIYKERKRKDRERRRR